MDYIKIKDNDYSLILENIDLNEKDVVTAACAGGSMGEVCLISDTNFLLDNTKTIVTRKLEMYE